MRRKGPIAGLLFMGVLIVLGTMGLVYGSWTETLNINGTVETGDVNVSIESKSIDEGGEKLKDIASCEQSASDTDDDTKDDKVAVTILNGFPGYSCHFWTNITNTGSLPVSVSAVLTGVNTDALRVDRSDDDPDLPKGDCEEAQLNTGQTTFCDWTVHVLKGADQDANYGFEINITAELINKPAAE